MAILAECPKCRNKQSVRNKVCKCGENLDKAKRSKRVKYWIKYRFPNGSQRKESVNAMKDLDGYSIDDAKAAYAKRQVEKRENRILDIKQDTKMTFRELAEWYLDLETVKALASFNTIKINIEKFNKVFGQHIVSSVKSADLENYQARRLKQGAAPGTVDHEVGKTKTMIFKAFDNDIVGGETLKAFKRVKKTLKSGSDVRDRILSQDEFKALIKHSSEYLQGIIFMGYYTGMRRGEIFNLTWDKVDLAARLIWLNPEDTKDNKARKIPICDELCKYLMAMPNRIQSSGWNNHVFLFRGRPLKTIRNGLSALCKKAGIKYGRFKKGGFVFHDLRHTFNTNMRKAGVQESVIMEITGHSTREMFDRYNTIDEEDAQKAVNQLEVFLGFGPHSVPQKRGKKNLIRKTSSKPFLSSDLK